MKKKYILSAIALCFIITLVSSSNQASITQSAAPSVVPAKEASTSDGSDLTSEWRPNHGSVNITFQQTKDDATQEYVFISPTEGWKAYTDRVGAGQVYIELYKTTDSGENWSEITFSEDSTLNGGDIMFKNSREGWITTYVPAEGVLVLYKTSDGGTTWVTQQVMTPSEYADALFYPCMPMFFSEKDGIIFAMSDIESNFDCAAFITHDGGETWSFQSKEGTDESLTWNCKMTNQLISDMEVTYGKEIWYSADGVVWENR